MFRNSPKQFVLTFFAAALFSGAVLPAMSQQLTVGHLQLMRQRAELAADSQPQKKAQIKSASMSAGERRALIDAFWGAGEPTEEKLRKFDIFWNYVEAKYAAFQGVEVDWYALRDRYRPEVAAGVSRGRFAAIMNQLSLALQEPHTQALDLEVNAFTVPDRGVPILAVGDTSFNPSGACTTTGTDGTALVYSAMEDHPLGLERGDVVLGYDGRPWTELYPELLAEEIPMWPLFWGGSPTSLFHSFNSSVTMNWHLFDVMDVRKANGTTVHVPTSLMPGPIWYGFCSEQLPVAGVEWPEGAWENAISSGVVTGTNTGYVYVWAWGPDSEVEFESQLRDLIQVRGVNSLIVDFRFNNGGILHAAQKGLGLLFDRPEPGVGFDGRRRFGDHFAMQSLSAPGEFTLDFDIFPKRTRIKLSFDGPIALLTGPSAVSSGDMSTLWLSMHPRVRTFGKPTSSAFNLPTQPALGTEIDLGPDWFARIAERNLYRVGQPKDYFTHRDLPIDQTLWLRSEDVAAGTDTVVAAALNWIGQQ